MFEITENQKSILNAWLDVQEKKAIVMQKKKIKKKNSAYAHYKNSWDEGYAYDGAVGIGPKYMFTTTSIGTIVTVKYKTDDVIDLTDYGTW